MIALPLHGIHIEIFWELINAVEIEEAVFILAEQPFEADAFSFAFMEAFGSKSTTIKRLTSGSTHKSDVGGVLQRGNIHIETCAAGEVATTVDPIRDCPVTAKQKAPVYSGCGCYQISF